MKRRLRKIAESPFLIPAIVESKILLFASCFRQSLSITVGCSSLINLGLLRQFLFRFKYPEFPFIISINETACIILPISLGTSLIGREVPIAFFNDRIPYSGQSSFEYTIYMSYLCRFYILRTIISIAHKSYLLMISMS